MESAKQVISNLKFISKIDAGDKIDTINVYKMPPTWTSSFLRTIRMDNRRSTLAFISSTIKSTFELLEYMERTDNCLFDAIVKDLVDCQHGLKNLKVTYSDDIKFQCDIDTMLQIIQSKLNLPIGVSYSPRKKKFNGRRGKRRKNSIFFGTTCTRTGTRTTDSRY